MTEKYHLFEIRFSYRPAQTVVIKNPVSSNKASRVVPPRVRDNQRRTIMAPDMESALAFFKSVAAQENWTEVRVLQVIHRASVDEVVPFSTQSKDFTDAT